MCSVVLGRAFGYPMEQCVWTWYVEGNAFSFVSQLVHHFTAHRKSNLNSSATRKYSCEITAWSDHAGNEGLLKNSRKPGISYVQ